VFEIRAQVKLETNRAQVKLETNLKEKYDHVNAPLLYTIVDFLVHMVTCHVSI
jgi:hypothetical protein